ncbi:methyltransferase domain-containing protein [Desulfobacca acetoxidans]
MNQSRKQCRFCDNVQLATFVDLGLSPLANAFVHEEQLHGMEPFYALHCYVCPSCFLVQLPELASSEAIFSDYAYFSSYSETWLEHAREYTAAITHRLQLGPQSSVIEIASNDGYLLQYFVERGIPVLGIEPAANVARVAQGKGIPTLVDFFSSKLGRALADQGKQGDLIIGNNVLAHVPDLNDFVAGLKIMLKPDGVITLEFPHLLRLMAENQFDTIYHEHFSYFSFTTAEKVFAAHGLKLFDVQELPTHGGSLRVYACHAGHPAKAEGERVNDLRHKEKAFGITELTTYRTFAENVKQTKRQILNFLIQAKEEGKQIAGYGAPAKGNTLLNYCGIRTDFLDYTVDLSPHKQGLFLPGTHIPIAAPDLIRATKPDYLFILPWNLKEEIMAQMAYIREWGGKFVTPIPEIRVY